MTIHSRMCQVVKFVCHPGRTSQPGDLCFHKQQASPSIDSIQPRFIQVGQSSAHKQSCYRRPFQEVQHSTFSQHSAIFLCVPYHPVQDHMETSGEVGPRLSFPAVSSVVPCHAAPTSLLFRVTEARTACTESRCVCSPYIDAMSCAQHPSESPRAHAVRGHFCLTRC